MDVEPTLSYKQSDTIQIKKLDKRGAEVLPDLWGAAEQLTSPALESRWEGLNNLLEMDAIRHSPLVAYILTTRISETDLGLRTGIILALADVLTTEEEKSSLSEDVQTRICLYLSKMRKRQIFSLLQVADNDLSGEESVYRLLNCCSYAGKHLSNILLDRKIPIRIRMRAVSYVERIGYLDALPALERAVNRIESRKNGRFSGSLDNGDQGDERELSKMMEQAMEILRSP